MTEQQSSYRQIFKTTSLFGGVQVLTILVGIIRVKFVAVLLGTTGVGIMNLLNSPINLIISITSFGVAFSAVRDISEANGSGDQTLLAKTIITLRRWSWFTGLLGAIVTITLAPLLSQWSFGNREYTWAFVWLSVTLLLQALSKGQGAIMQGMRKIKEMAKAGVIGSALGLITSIPLYYFYGLKGIVPAIIVTAVTTLFLSWYFAHRIVTEKIPFTYKETYSSGLKIAKLGIYMTIAGFVTSFTAYILNTYISNLNGIEQVGLYNAGWGVIGQYTGLIFAAMATDYFPRLSAIQADDGKVKELVNQQAETALLITAPLLALLIVAMPMVVRILYNAAFLPIVVFVDLTILGIQFKTVSWALGYIYLAKGDGRLYMIIEIFAGILVLLVNLLFYYLYGLNGLGISFILTYLLSMIFSYFVLRRKYGFSFPKKLYQVLILTYGFVVITFLTTFIRVDIFKYVSGIFILMFSVWYSLFRLNNLMDLKSFFVNRIKR